MNALASLTTSWPLLHSHSLTVRALRRDDADLEYRLGRGLSRESITQRFLSGGVKLTLALAERLLDIDYSRDAALVATTVLEGREMPLGIARYARLDDGYTGEIALTVADAWHRCGVGRLLMVQLEDVGRQAGLRRFVGDVFATNVAMLGLARSLGYATRFHPEGAIYRRIEKNIAVADES